MKSLETQIGGNHYKNLKIQPMEFCMTNKLDYCQSLVVRYISRYKEKNGVEDLEKAIHCIDMMIDFYYGEVKREHDAYNKLTIPTVDYFDITQTLVSNYSLLNNILYSVVMHRTKSDLSKAKTMINELINIFVDAPF